MLFVHLFWFDMCTFYEFKCCSQKRRERTEFSNFRMPIGTKKCKLFLALLHMVAPELNAKLGLTHVM